MMDRKEMRKKRMSLGIELDDLEERIEKGEEVDQKEYDRIREELFKLSHSKGQKSYKSTPGAVISTKTPAEVGLTAIVYLMLKDQGKIDEKIRSEMNISYGGLKKFKKENFLQGYSLMPVLLPTRESKISDEIKQLAAENGIGIKALVRRIFEHEWDEMKAATEPIINGGRTKKVGN